MTGTGDMPRTNFCSPFSPITKKPKNSNALKVPSPSTFCAIADVSLFFSPLLYAHVMQVLSLNQYRRKHSFLNFQNLFSQTLLSFFFDSTKRWFLNFLKNGFFFIYLFYCEVIFLEGFWCCRVLIVLGGSLCGF